MRATAVRSGLLGTRCENVSSSCPLRQVESFDPARSDELDGGQQEHEILQNELTDPTVSQGLNDFRSVLSQVKTPRPTQRWAIGRHISSAQSCGLLVLTVRRINAMYGNVEQFYRNLDIPNRGRCLPETRVSSFL